MSDWARSFHAGRRRTIAMFEQPERDGRQFDRQKGIAEIFGRLCRQQPRPVMAAPQSRTRRQWLRPRQRDQRNLPPTRLKRRRSRIAMAPNSEAMPKNMREVDNRIGPHARVAHA